MDINNMVKDKLAEKMNCTRCKGVGKVPSLAAIMKEEGKENELRECYNCKGVGTFDRPDFDAIFDRIVTTRKGKRSIRSTKPKDADDRTYYVWRLARFHGGIDVTLPVMATMGLNGDPYESALDEFASVMAKQFYGSDIVGAMRWRTALGA